MIIQLTNKCNLNCFYCECSKEEPKEMPFQEVIEVVKEAVKQGETEFELSGGEPLLYPNVEEVLHELKQIDGVQKVTISTNGIHLSGKLERLKAAGLDGINIHMDTTDAWKYVQITGAEKVLNDVLSGMWLAYAQDIPIRLHVVLHEKSKDSLVVLAGFAKKMEIDICFVSCEGYSKEAGLSEETVVKKLSRHFKNLEQVEEHVYVSPELKGRVLFTTR